MLVAAVRRVQKNKSCVRSSTAHPFFASKSKLQCWPKKKSSRKTNWELTLKMWHKSNKRSKIDSVWTMLRCITHAYVSAATVAKSSVPFKLWLHTRTRYRYICKIVACNRFEHIFLRRCSRYHRRRLSVLIFRFVFNFIYHTNQHTLTHTYTDFGYPWRVLEPRDVQTVLSFHFINIQLWYQDDTHIFRMRWTHTLSLSFSFFVSLPIPQSVMSGANDSETLKRIMRKKRCWCYGRNSNSSSSR